MFAFALLAAAASAGALRTPLALDLSGLRPAPWETTAVEPRATVVRGAIRQARAGETVRSVGEATGVGANAIIRANGLTPPYALRAGQTLIVPGGRYHRVGVGDTGIAIARAYGVAWSRIIDANALAEPFDLRIGQRLVLPDRAGSSGRRSDDRAMEQRAAAFQIGIDDIVTGGALARPGTWTARQPSPPAKLAAASPRAFLWPASGPIVASFGSQGRGRINQGLDVAASPGSLVRATAGGEVAYVGRGVPGFGGLILVRHDGGWISAYGRIASAVVGRGARVSAGQSIGRLGEDALHFELRRARIAVDPVRYLPPRG